MARRTLLGALALGSIALFAAPRIHAVCEPVFAGPTTVADLGLNNRAFGLAAGDFDEDGNADVIAGRSDGRLFFIKGLGDGTFAAQSQYTWKQASFNNWTLSTADVDGDGHLDIVWGASADSPTTSPVVQNGEVRYFKGNGDGTFVLNQYTISGVIHNAGSLLADIGTRAATVAAGDIDGDGDGDVVVGGIDGTDTVVKIIRNNGASFSLEELIRMAISVATPASPIYFPPPSTSATNQTLDRPWGLALGDADNDGDLDLWIADRAFYVYLYRNSGAGVFILQGGNVVVAGRPNVYLAHDAYRPAVGYTLSIAAGDVNRDAKADIVLGLLNEKSSGTLSGLAHDGEILLDTSLAADGHVGFGLITGSATSDAGSCARGVAIADVNGDGWRDAIVGTWEGPVKLFLSQPPSRAACDDGNDCSVDSCVGGACAHTQAADTTPCSDGLFCTVGDACTGGVCVSGSARDCGDGIDCTLDNCDEAKGCTSAPVDSACSDANVCTTDTCDPASDCISVPGADGTTCVDGDPCTVGDACVAGNCQPGTEPLDCNDNNPCTDDSCDPASGCVHVENAASCDDSDACTYDDVCAAGACGGTAIVCANDQCNTRACNGTSACTVTPLSGNACDDGVACTYDDVCTAGACGGTAIVCANDQCNTRACNGTSACTVTPLSGNACDDGDACTYGDVCAAGACGGTSIVCANDQCNTRACNGTGACTVTPLSGNACDDGDACTYGDVCAAGACGGTSIVCANDQCNTRACNGTGACTVTPLSGNACDDGDACTYDDVCAAGACGGTSIVCANDQCNTRACNGTGACTVTPLSGNACDDGDACTYDDVCAAGACGGTSIVCANDQCNTRACNGTGACTVTPLSGNACDDGDACSHDDVCAAGACGGTSIVCANDQCNTRACNGTGACTVTPLSGNACDDGNACTTNDTCTTLGTCDGGPAPSCDDGNVCTADGCNPATGCVSAPLTGNACDDGSLCTTGDTCQNGLCLGQSHANEPRPKTSGYYKKLCKGPHKGDQLTQADVECVNDEPNYLSVASIEDICFYLDLPHDVEQEGECRKAEKELMTVTLNRCRARVCDASAIQSHCGDGENATVDESVTEAAALISDSGSRTKEMCKASACLTHEINNGHAFKVDKVHGDRSGNDGIVLTWEEPYLEDGDARPTGYEIYRQAMNDPTDVFTKIGTTTQLTYTDDTPGDFEYEIVAIVPELP